MTNDKSKKIGDYTKTPKSKELFTLMIENLFCLIFGKKAYYGTASAFGNPAYFKRHIIKLVDKFIAEIAELHASEKFIDYLNYQLGYLKKEILSAGDLSNETKGILIVNLKIVATLLGHAQASGDRREEPYFIPSLWAEMQGWIDLGQYLNTKEYLTKQIWYLINF